MGEVQVDGVVFDFDGVIVDSTEAVERQWTGFAEHVGLDPAELLEHVHGRRNADIVARWVPREQQAEAAAWLAAHGVDHRTVPVLPGAREALAAASAGRWAIASSATRDSLTTWLDVEGLARPPVLISADDVTRGKPDPECYLRAAEGLGLSPADCVVVEDAPLGVEAANAAGIGCVVALLTTHARADLAHASVVVPDLGHLRITPEGDGFTVGWD